MSSRTPRESHRTRVAIRRSSRPRIDHLESRTMLSLTVVQPTFVMRPMAGGPPTGAYAPAQILQAYGFNNISFSGAPGTGKGETIAIVDAYDDPKIQSDLNVFDSQFGLAPTTVIRVNQTGGTSYPASDSSGGWELEESLDVEWAHAIAPQASIMLVEANSATDTDLLAAVKYASAHANVVSMSWGGGEFSGETSYDSTYFAKAGVVFVASSGDSGAPASWPAASPNVLSVGGTALTLGASNAWSSEVGWNDSGGGPSTSEPQPSYQKGVVTQTTKARGTPDVAYDASPSTGFAVYDSVPYSGTTYGWLGVGGTSAGAPQWAALLAIADQGRASSGQPAINSTNPQEVMNVLYKNPGDFHDITSGTSLGQPHYSAGLGYDYVTGLGSPIANLVVGSFVGTSTPAPSDKLVLAATAAETAGVSFSLTVTALEFDRGDGHRLSGHCPLHQRRSPVQPAGKLYVYRGRPRNAYVHGHDEDRRRPVDHGDGYSDFRHKRHAFRHRRQSGGRQSVHPVRPLLDRDRRRGAERARSPQRTPMEMSRPATPAPSSSPATTPRRVCRRITRSRTQIWACMPSHSRSEQPARNR